MKTKKCNNCEHIAKTLAELYQHMKVTHDDHFGFKNLNLKLENIEERIANFQAEKNFNIIKDQVEHLIDDADNLNCLKMWKLRKKLGGKKCAVPVAKIDSNGKLVTNSEQLKELYKSTYKNRMQHRIMKPELKQMFDRKMNLFELRIKVSKYQKCDEWTENELSKVLRKLKKDKSEDSEGLIYELFRPETIGASLFSYLLMLCNRVKSEMTIPRFLTNTNITSIYKNKGNKNNLENDRGIFGVTKIRSILEKLVYEDIYDMIDNTMSDSNVGEDVREI